MGGAVARAVALACLLAAGLYTGPRGFRPWDDIAQAPLLAVARVESVAVKPVTPEEATLPTPKRTCTDGTRLRLNYPCYPVDTPGGRSEVLPEIGTGGVYLVPFAGGRMFR